MSLRLRQEVQGVPRAPGLIAPSAAEGISGAQRRARALVVAAGLLQHADGRWLIAQRAPGKSDGGLWEFPGGKLHPGESAAQALRRELIEELGIMIDGAQALAVVRWSTPARRIHLHGLCVRTWAGEPQALEHAQLRWAHARELIHYAMPTPDVPLRARIALPAQYLITPEPEAAPSRFLRDLALSLQNPHIGMISLRAKALDADARARLAERLLRVARDERPDLIVLVHDDCALVERLGFDGAHLSSRALAAAGTRPLAPGRWLLASCHTYADLAHAERLVVDAAVLGPVLPTLSHPGARTLGWRAFAGLARRTWVPLYALGGVGPAHAQQATASGAIGVAGIRAFFRASVAD